MLKIDYESDYQRGFKAFDSKDYQGAGKEELRTTVENIRKSHFSLGDEPDVDYLSATHQSLRSVEGYPPADTAKHAQMARELRQQLQKTTFTIGDDPEYM